MTPRWLKVPTGPHGPRWRTVTPQRTILIVVHTITALNRFADILPVFDSDRRVQLIFTFPDASAIAADVETYLHEGGAVVMPWEQAIVMEFDLALSAHHSGNLHEINAPLVVLSHGMGYTKYSTGNRKPETGNRKPETGNRSVYGLSPQWLISDGAVIPSAIILSHAEQRIRLGQSVPQALSAAVVAGDPCFDRMVASAHLRRRYRTALGATDDTTVVLVSSTWGSKSLFGRFPDMIAELLAELDIDNYVVAVALHPNVWFAHGIAQIRLWLGDCLRSGLRLIPPVQGWQHAVIAADVVCGDHGAVTGYGAGIGRATLLGTFPADDVVESSAIDVLGHVATRLDLRQPYLPQIQAAIAEAAPDRFAAVRDLTTSEPGESAQILRQTFYRLMELPEPPGAAPVPTYPVDDLVPERVPMTAWWASAEQAHHGGIVLRRWPADVVTPRAWSSYTGDRHLVVGEGYQRRDLASNAAIVVLDPVALHGDGDLFGVRPACVLTVTPCGDRTCRVVHRDGHTVSLTADDSAPAYLDVAAYASAIYAWLAGGRTWAELPNTLTVVAGGHRVELAVKRETRV